MHKIDPSLSPAENRMCFGQVVAQNRFVHAFQKQRLPHSWLLLGPQGIGKRTFAYQMIRFLVSGTSCFETFKKLSFELPVFQRIAAGTYSDLLVLEPEEKGKGVTVEVVRQMNAFLQKTAVEGYGRILLIDGLDQMNRHAANALLKSLEEPPPGVLFFMTAETLGGVLPTLRSRCQLLKLAFLGEETIKTLLAKAGFQLPPESFPILLDRSKGCLGQAFFWALEERWKKIPVFLNIVENAMLPPSHASFCPPMLPEHVTFLLQENMLFWKDIFLDWLEKQTIEKTLEAPHPRWQNMDKKRMEIKKLLLESQQFHLDPVHLWGCLFKILIT